jgi:hypothetical protein
MIDRVPLGPGGSLAGGAPPANIGSGGSSGGTTSVRFCI